LANKLRAANLAAKHPHNSFFGNSSAISKTSEEQTRMNKRGSVLESVRRCAALDICHQNMRLWFGFLNTAARSIQSGVSPLPLCHRTP
jgi:hypothetical protein